MAKKKPTPDAPVTSNPFKAPLTALKQELDAEAARRAAEAKSPKPAPKPAAPVTKAVTDVWRPNLEAELFAVAMAGVQPLTATGAPRVSARDPSVPARERPPAAIKARRAQAEGGESLRAEVTPEGVVTCAHPGKTFAVEALRRFATPDDALDLHGLTEPEALVRVQEFVRSRRARGLRCVQIVCGRGKRSPGNDAVLRDAAVRALCEPPTCRELDAFVSAPDHLGGGGGGGYYGGGGGAWGGGGGGSSYAGAGTSAVTHTSNFNSGNGSLVIAWSVPNTVCRASAGVCDPAEYCSGTGSACPSDARTSAGTICRATTGICDPQEVCDGSSVSCPSNTLTSAGTICRASGGICDPAETCTGAGGACPSDARTSAGTVCRSSAGICDVQEVCDGTSVACPTNSYVPAGATTSQTFNYTGSQQTWVVPTGVTSVTVDARGASGYTGTGSSPAGLGGRVQTTLSVTPGQTLYLFVGGAGTSCSGGGWNGGGRATCSYSSSGTGGGATDLRVGGTSLTDRVVVAGGGGGSGYNCASNDIGGTGGDLTGGTGRQCNSTSGGGTGGTQSGGGAGGTYSGYSSGIAGSQGQGGNAGSGTGGGGGGGGYYGGGGGAWGGGGGGSSYAGAGTSAVTHTSNFNSGNGSLVLSWAVAGTVCRASTGICDPAEYCSGSNANCPADTLTATGTVCRASAGICDPQETCTGTGVCPADVRSGTSVVCRAVAGICDVQEVCDGSSTACPANGFQSSSVVCRGAAGICDAVESCTGTGVACPSDGRLGTSVVCRAAGGVCDVQEVCDGTNVACPTDTFVTPPTTTVTFNATSTGPTGTRQSWTVPSGITSITVEAWGASGGNGQTVYGTSLQPAGRGAYIRGTLTVTPGQVLDILVGQQGGASGGPHGNENGGGGGTFVVQRTGNVPLVIAGGGGGAPSNQGYGTACSRSVSTGDGQAGTSGVSISCYTTATGGSGGGGGQARGSYQGGGGGGFSGNGEVGASHCSTVGGGSSYLSGGAGGYGGGCYDTRNWGGYGGGGGGQLSGPGGGGGYSGGASAGGWSSYSTYGGGGGSYNAGTAQTNTAGVNTGHGRVVITYAVLNSGTICRASAGICDPQETCDGSNVACPINTLTSAGTVCRATAGICDPQETCTGSSATCPNEVFTTAGTICRATAGICDPQETCTGSSATCPVNTFTTAGTVCRASAGICDPQETCTGSSAACPNQVFTTGGTVCRATAGICDPQEVCTGSSATCPNNTLTGAGTVCRASAGICDPQEVCTGSGATCPGDARTASGTVCRATAGICDPQETCDGTNVACPNNTLTGAGTVCRASAGICDPQETCTGSSATCPNQVFTTGGTVCRSSAGICDPQEVCTGSSATCPNNTLTGAGTVCRATAGICDPQEVCTGSSATCPNQVFTAGGTVCRSSAGICDVQEVCTGGMATCPGNSFQPSSTVCRASVNQPYCDPIEYCTGGAAACPGNSVIRTPVAETCNSVDDNCDGTVDEGSSNACGSAYNLGSVSVGGTVTRTEWIPSTSGAEQWYVVSFPMNPDYAQHGTGTPQIRLTAGASVRFDVRSDCSNNLACGTGGTASGLTTWSFTDSVSSGLGGFTTRSVAWPTTVYIRVYRVSAPTTCANQTLVISRPNGVGFQSVFAQGVVPNGTPACTNWNAYRAGLDASTYYESVTLSGSNDPTGRTCTGAAANTICQALRAGGATVSVSCGGVTWSVGQCGAGNIEVTAGGPFCSCGATYAARPCHGDSNFGGINGSTCGAATQQIAVNCVPARTNYQGAFTTGVTPNPTAACTTWNSYRSTLSASLNYQTVRLSARSTAAPNTANTTGRGCTGAAANQICQALRSGTTTSVACNGHTWTVGQCGTNNWEVNADGLFCNCGSSFAARPCHGDPNFGGVGIGVGSCGAQSQNIQVDCQPTLTYSQSFRQGETPSGTWQCSEWNGFRASINAGFSYSSITLSGSNDPRGRTCTGAAANTLCQAIRTGASTSVSCDGQTWSVGNCGGGIEVTAGGPFCSCGATYAARPCHPNPDFGGINGSTCGAAAQTLTVNCQ